MKKIILDHFILLFILAITIATVGCSFREGMTIDKPLSKTELLMDTIVTISLYDWSDISMDADKILEEAFQFCEEMEIQFSNTKEDGDIWRINHNIGENVFVSDSTIELLKLGKKYEQLSDGLFVMEIGSLSTLWDFHEGSRYFPSESEIVAAQKGVDISALTIGENYACLLGGQRMEETSDDTEQESKADSEQQSMANTKQEDNIEQIAVTQLDVGAIAKGYIADSLKSYLEEQGVTSAIINLGGNVLTVGSKPNGEAFSIGIQKPFSKENETTVGVKVKDSAVVTSGVYQRYFEQNGKIYHHILDPNTGYPAKTDLHSVTILSKDSVDGDAISTICMILGKEKGMEFVESLDGIEGIFITEEEQIYYTSGITESMLIR